MSRILVVDDEQDLCEILQFNLQQQGYETVCVNSAEEALTIEDLNCFDLILLDVMMDGMSGFEFAKQLKQRPELSEIPIIFCTARDSENDFLKGFELGADDYIAKPFSIRQVLARVRAVLRRSGKTDNTSANNDNQLVFKQLVINRTNKRVYLNGGELMLTPKEYGILELLMSFPNKLFQRQEILEQIWPEDCYVINRTVDVTVARLRKKLGNSYGSLIVSRTGYGYSFSKQKEEL